jgi:hypothetical protein
MSREHISELLEGRGIVLHATTIKYHLGLNKKKSPVKSYLDYVPVGCRGRGVPYHNPVRKNRGAKPGI